MYCITATSLPQGLYNVKQYSICHYEIKKGSALKLIQLLNLPLKALRVEQLTHTKVIGYNNDVSDIV